MRFHLLTDTICNFAGNCNKKNAKNANFCDTPLFSADFQVHEKINKDYENHLLAIKYNNKLSFLKNKKDVLIQICNNDLYCWGILNEFIRISFSILKKQAKKQNINNKISLTFIEIIKIVNQGNVCLSTIGRKIKKLKDLGFIEVSKFYEKRRSGKSNLTNQKNSYQINWDVLNKTIDEFLVNNPNALKKKRHSK